MFFLWSFHLILLAFKIDLLRVTMTEFTRGSFCLKDVDNKCTLIRLSNRTE